MAARITGCGLADAHSADDVCRLARLAARNAVRAMVSPALVLGFVTSTKSRAEAGVHLLRAAEGLRSEVPGAALVLGDSPGVFSDESEREGLIAVSALAFDASAATVRLGTLPVDTPRNAQRALIAEAASAAPVAGATPSMVLAMLAPDTHTTECLTELGSSRPSVVIGAGTSTVAAAHPRCEPILCGAALTSLATRLSITTIVSQGCKLITPWMTVSKADAPFLLSLDGRRPLDVVNEHTEREARNDALLVAVAPRDADAPPLLRTIAGIDVARGAIAVGESLPQGTRVALAVRDPAASRADLVTRFAAGVRGGLGAAPAAALMFACAGRGQRFYGRSDVDASAIRARLAGVPIAGMRSAFEIAPWCGTSRVHLYAVACVVFSRLS